MKVFRNYLTLFSLLFIFAGCEEVKQTQLFLISNTSDNQKMQCLAFDRDRSIMGDKRNFFKFDACVLQDINWFTYDGGSIASAYYPDAIYIKGITNSKLQFLGKGVMKVPTSTGTRSISYISRNYITSQGNLESFANRLYLTGDANLVFQAERRREISALFTYLNSKSPSFLGNMLSLYPEDLTLTLNNKMTITNHDMLSSEAWRRKFAKKFKTNADLNFLKKQLTDYIRFFVVKYYGKTNIHPNIKIPKNSYSYGVVLQQSVKSLANAQSYGDIQSYGGIYTSRESKYPQVAFKEFLKNLPNSGITNHITVGSDNRSRILLSQTFTNNKAGWAEKIFNLSYAKLSNNYPKLLKKQNFSFSVAVEYIKNNKKYFGLDNIPATYTVREVFDNFIADNKTSSIPFHVKVFDDIAKSASSTAKTKIFTAVPVEAYRAKMVFVLTYIHEFFNETDYMMFHKFNFTNGPKAYDAVNKIYDAILGAYVPDEHLKYSPDIYVAKLTRKMYERLLLTGNEGSTLKDKILQAQDGFSLAYKHYPVFYSTSIKDIDGVKKARLEALVLRKVNWLGEIFNFLFTFDLIYGFVESMSSIFVSIADDFSESFGSTEVMEMESEEASFGSGIGSEGSESVLCL